MNIDALVLAAVSARQSAYAPYSRFSVGAALQTTDGEIFTGCNVENISFGLTLCAERGALVAAVAAGYRSFAAMAVAADTTSPISPCGACRQVLAEFSPTLMIISTTLSGISERFSLADLLPRAKTGILEFPENSAESL